jgi:choice-of-anchor A domain-containing protein
MVAAMRGRFFLGGALVALAAAGEADAAPLSIAELLHQFNVVTTGDFQSSSEVEGRTYIGGNLISNTSSNYNVFGSGVTPSSDYDELIVAGSITGTAPVNVNNGGNVTVGGSVAPIVNLNGGGTLTSAPADPTPAEIAGLLASGTSLYRGLSANAAFDASDLNSVKFTAAGTAGEATIYEVDYDDLALFRGIELGAGLASAVIINVTDTIGRSLAPTANFLGGSLASAASVLWTFDGADSLTVGTWFGSILAPGTLLANTGNVEGSVAVGSVQSRGELHLQPFEGVVPDPGPDPSEVPEIDARSGLAALAALAGLLALIRERRRPA